MVPSRDALPCAADAAMDRYADGDEDAFAIVYDALAPRLYRYLMRQTQDTARSEDLLQQTFLKMHRARGRFIRGASVTTWSFAIARRLYVDDLRRSARRPSAALRTESPPSALEPDRMSEGQHTASTIQETLARLPESQRLAFELVKWEGLSLAETAEVLGITVPAVKALTHRAYRALRTALRDTVEHAT